MIYQFQRQRSTLSYRVLSAFIVVTFIFSVITPPAPVYAQMIPQGLANLPLPGTMVALTPGFTPPLVLGMTVHPENPLEFDFIIGSGDDRLEGQAFENESTRLIKYFLAALTVPEEEMWVNLSPYEKDRIIPESFGTTEMGRDLLAQDYILKQLTASLMYPEKELGDQFWTKVRAKAQEKFGTSEIPMNTFNKVWIVPESASIYEHGQSVFVVASHLKVMLEEDYVALQENKGAAKYGLDSIGSTDADIISGVSSEVVREILIPEIEKEVNQGETFANLRQIYNSMILAAWYKQNLQGSLLGQVYVNQNKTKGVDIKDKQENQKIYAQYLEAFKKGVYNYIREDYDPATQQIIPRKYFSGGIKLKATNLKIGDDIIKKETSASPVVQEFLTRDNGVKKTRVNLVEVVANGKDADDVSKLASISSPVKIIDVFNFKTDDKFDLLSYQEDLRYLLKAFRVEQQRSKEPKLKFGGRMGSFLEIASNKIPGIKRDYSGKITIPEQEKDNFENWILKQLSAIYEYILDIGNIKEDYENWSPVLISNTQINQAYGGYGGKIDIAMAPGTGKSVHLEIAALTDAMELWNEKNGKGTHYFIDKNGNESFYDEVYVIRNVEEPYDYEIIRNDEEIIIGNKNFNLSDNPYVSERHIKIRRVNDSVFEITDLGSPYKTLVATFGELGELDIERVRERGDDPGTIMGETIVRSGNKLVIVKTKQRKSSPVTTKTADDVAKANSPVYLRGRGARRVRAVAAMRGLKLMGDGRSNTVPREEEEKYVLPIAVEKQIRVILKGRYQDTFIEDSKFTSAIYSIIDEVEDWTDDVIRLRKDMDVTRSAILGTAVDVVKTENGGKVVFDRPNAEIWEIYQKDASKLTDWLRQMVRDLNDRKASKYFSLDLVPRVILNGDVNVSVSDFNHAVDQIQKRIDLTAKEIRVAIRGGEVESSIMKAAQDAIKEENNKVMFYRDEAFWGLDQEAARKLVMWLGQKKEEVRKNSSSPVTKNQSTAPITNRRYLNDGRILTSLYNPDENRTSHMMKRNASRMFDWVFSETGDATQDTVNNIITSVRLQNAAIADDAKNLKVIRQIVSSYDPSTQTTTHFYGDTKGDTIILTEQGNAVESSYYEIHEKVNKIQEERAKKKDLKALNLDDNEEVFSSPINDQFRAIKVRYNDEMKKIAYRGFGISYEEARKAAVEPIYQEVSALKAKTKNIENDYTTLRVLDDKTVEFNGKQYDREKVKTGLQGFEFDLKDGPAEYVEYIELIRQLQADSAEEVIALLHAAEMVIPDMGFSEGPGNPGTWIIPKSNYAWFQDWVSHRLWQVTNRSASPVVDAKTNVGGINLNPALLDLQIKRDGNGVPLPMNLQPIGQMKIDGFVPVIINITPVTNLPLLLGFAEKDVPSGSAESKPQPAAMKLGFAEKYRHEYGSEYTDSSIVLIG